MHSNLGSPGDDHFLVNIILPATSSERPFQMFFDNRAIAQNMGMFCILVSTVSPANKEVTIIVKFLWKSNEIPCQVFPTKPPQLPLRNASTSTSPYCCPFFLTYSYPTCECVLRWYALSYTHEIILLPVSEFYAFLNSSIRRHNITPIGHKHR